MNLQTRLLLFLILPLAGIPAHAAGPEPGLSPGEETPAHAQPDSVPEPAADPTVIDSDRLEMISEEEETRFVFSGNVSVTGNNLVVLCDRLEVFTSRFEEAEGPGPGTPSAPAPAPPENPDSLTENPEKSAPAGETNASAQPASASSPGDPVGLGRLRLIVATGQVRIFQGEGREATAGRAELRPREGLIILMENPVFRDAQGTVSGPRIVLDQNRNEAIVEGTPEQRARVTLPSLPDFSPGGRTRNPEEPPRAP